MARKLRAKRKPYSNGITKYCTSPKCDRIGQRLSIETEFYPRGEAHDPYCKKCRIKYQKTYDTKRLRKDDLYKTQRENWNYKAQQKKYLKEKHLLSCT